MEHMAVNRLEILKGMLEQNPNDNFARYGLAMEYANSGKLAEAVEEYEALLGVNPDYAAAYYHGGQALEKLGRLDDARSIYRRGLEATRRTGDAHTHSEIQAALDILG
jgi:tetratricopeptide (TPR) repeat protein